MNLELAQNLVARPITREQGVKQLTAVMIWELRRIRAGRFHWLMLGVALLCFLGIMWVRHTWYLTDTLALMGTTRLGQLVELVYGPMLFFGVMLPFLAADAIAYDYKQRVHELLMTTPLPNWVYVGGRYLAGLLLCLVLGAILLVAQLAMNVALSQLETPFPPPDPAAALLFWAVIVLPATVTVCSLCVAAGALYPRWTTIIKLGVCIVWVILAMDQDPRDLTWRAYWNPTGAGMATLRLAEFGQNVQNGIRTITDPTQQLSFALQLQQQMPDVRPWLGPYLVLVGLAMLLVVLTALAFNRFRSVMNG